MQSDVYIVHTYILIYVYMYVCMYVCMYVYIFEGKTGAKHIIFQFCNNIIGPS